MYIICFFVFRTSKVNNNFDIEKFILFLYCRRRFGRLEKGVLFYLVQHLLVDILNNPQNFFIKFACVETQAFLTE